MSGCWMCFMVVQPASRKDNAGGLLTVYAWQACASLRAAHSQPIQEEEGHLLAQAEACCWVKEQGDSMQYRLWHFCARTCHPPYSRRLQMQATSA